MPLITTTSDDVTGSTTGTLWRGWNDQYAVTSTTTSATDTTWNRWVIRSTNNITTSATTANDDVWRIFCTTAGTSATTTSATTITWANWVDQTGAPAPRHRTHIEVHGNVNEEARRRRAEEQERWRAQRAEEAAKRKKANETAMQLLRSMLTDEQNRDLADHGYFYVRSPSGRLYRIDKGTHGNVKVVPEKGKPWIEKLCIQPSGVPDGDAMLMQKLMIETNEVAFRAYANITTRDGYHYGRRGRLDAAALAEMAPMVAREPASA
jgi:hypothetical protein